MSARGAKAERGRRRTVVTPEGIPIVFTVASAGERIGAFILDGLIVAFTLGTLLVAAFFLLVAMAISRGPGMGFIGAFALVAIFLLRNFYFIGFELRWGGRTPGKWVLGIQVMDRHGGPLRGEAIFARNLTRELEMFIPFIAVLGAGGLWPGAPWWARLLALLWLLIFAMLPLFNRDRLRVGDLVAGTMVVRTPKPKLLKDLSARQADQATGEMRSSSRYRFNDRQLDMYGVYELQVLEDVLRKRGRERREMLKVVCEKIKRKIAWDPEDWDVDAEEFLREFYTAQRARLEKQMVHVGERRERKKKGRLRRRERESDG